MKDMKGRQEIMASKTLMSHLVPPPLQLYEQTPTYLGFGAAAIYTSVWVQPEQNHKPPYG
jgi:hypothetical protein